jgi:predicted small metal-binding protein
MINRIYAYLGFVLTALGALYGIHRSGKQSGKQQAEAKQDAEKLEQIQKMQKEIHKAGHLSNDDIRNIKMRKGDF